MKKTKTTELRYLNYLKDTTDKKINLFMISGIFILLILMYSDYRLRSNITAIYARIPSLIIALVILAIKNFKSQKNKLTITFLYNLFLFTILAMMYAKFLIHLNTDSEKLNTLSIVTAIFIVSLELRTKVGYSAGIFFGTLVLFLSVLFSFFSYNINVIMPLVNVFIMTFVGFLINRIQNTLRFKNFLSESLLKTEKQKLNESNKKQAANNIELNSMNIKLENKNKALKDINKELEGYNDLFVGREFRIKELKDKINELEEKLNNINK